MDAAGKVVYIGRFSKVFFPAVLLGYLVVPPALWDVFVAARNALDIFSPTLYQLVLADFLREGHFARDIRCVRTVHLDGLRFAHLRKRAGSRAARAAEYPTSNRS